jgi:hypothetical protein
MWHVVCRVGFLVCVVRCVWDILCVMYVVRVCVCGRARIYVRSKPEVMSVAGHNLSEAGYMGAKGKALYGLVCQGADVNCIELVTL